MRDRRVTLVVSLATFVGIAVVATLILGNSVGAPACGARWTGYVPIGSCVRSFWSAAFYLGPLIGLVAAVCAALLADRATRRA